MKVYGVMGWKNSGKTGLVERLVAEITARGLRVSTVKHAHHDVDLDQPGKDSWRHRQAGALEVVVASAHRYAILHETRGPELPLAALLAQMAPVDLVLVEGYKRDAHPKIEVLRAETGQPLIQPADATVRAVASNAGLVGLSVPHFDLDDTPAIADFLLADCGLAAPGANEGRFDSVVVVDWSAKATLSPRRESKDAIWIGVTTEGATRTIYQRSRAEAEATLAHLFSAEAAAGRRVLAGFDFPFGYPAGFAAALTGQSDPLALWDWLAGAVEDKANNQNNRFELANRINARLGPAAPFWGRPAHLPLPSLPATRAVSYGHGFAERRAVERSVPRAHVVWKLFTTGSVGSQTLLGLPVLARLRRLAGAAVWPFQPATGPLVFAEIYPGLIEAAVKADGDPIKDRAQVRLLSQALWRLARQDGLAALLALPQDPAIVEEGWILGAGQQQLLHQALA